MEPSILSGELAASIKIQAFRRGQRERSIVHQRKKAAQIGSPCGSIGDKLRNPRDFKVFKNLPHLNKDSRIFQGGNSLSPQDR